MQYFWTIFIKMDYLSQLLKDLALCSIVTFQAIALSQTYTGESQPGMIGGTPRPEIITLPTTSHCL